jgi:hypothetical protein
MAVMPRARIVIALTLAVATAGLAAGCGSSSSDTSSPDKWADSFCGAIVTWQNDLTSIGTSLKSGTPSKATLETAGQQAEDATQTLADSLKSLGKPDTQAGADAQAAVTQLQNDLTTDTEAIKKATSGVSSLSGTLTAISSISATLATMATQVSSTATTLQQLDPKGELESAFSKSSNCKTLKSS